MLCYTMDDFAIHVDALVCLQAAKMNILKVENSYNLGLDKILFIIFCPKNKVY